MENNNVVYGPKLNSVSTFICLNDKWNEVTLTFSDKKYDMVMMDNTLFVVWINRKEAAKIIRNFRNRKDYIVEAERKIVKRKVYFGK